jgi:hypothetical protein
MRVAAQILLILGLIIAVPAAIDATKKINDRLQEWGVWQKIDDTRRAWEENRQAQKQQISFDLRNSTDKTLEIEFSGENGDYWPGGNQVYLLNPGAVATFPLKCSFEAQKICFGAWVSGDSNSRWGVGYKRASGCENCCTYCGGSFSTALVYK